MAPAAAFQLRNGMRFIVCADAAVRGVAAGFWVRAGVCDEPADRRGMAHFFEHLMFRGSANYAAGEHMRRIARYGGMCNASTGYDATVFYETGPPEALDEIFRLEADRFRRPRLTRDNVELERKVVLEELHVYENQPRMRALRTLARLVAGEHPYAIDPLGRAEDLAAASLEDFRRFWEYCYAPARTFCVVVGDVERPQVRELAEQHFGGWQPGEAAAVAPAPALPPKNGRLTARVSLSVPVTARVHWLKSPAACDLPALEMLVSLLARGEAAPIREALVRRKRLCVDAGYWLLHMLGGGALVFFGAFLPPGRHASRWRIMADLCNRIASEGPDDRQLEPHLKAARRAYAAQRYSLLALTHGYGNAQMLEGDYARYERRLDDLAAVDAGRVQALAAALFAPANTLELAAAPERVRWWLLPVGILAKIWPRR